MAITISDVSPRIQYTATAAQTSFSVPFEFFADSNLIVQKTAISDGAVTTLTLSASPANAAQYSVSGAGVTGGGSITLGGGATVNDKYTISRNLPIARTTDFATTGIFPIDSLNTELDKIIAMMQQQGVDINLSPRASSTTSTAYGLIFPELVADKILSVNSAGDALEFDQSITDVSAVAAIAAEIVTVAGIDTEVTTVSGIASDVTAVAGDATDIGAVADKATEIGRLGTADAVADMAILGTSDVVNDMNVLGSAGTVTAMNLLGTADVVSDMNILATADVVADMNTLGTADVVVDMNVLGTADVVSDMNTLGTSDVVDDMAILGASGVVANIATVAGISGDVTTVAGISGNVTTVSDNDTNVTTVATNIVDVNTFANQYRIGSSDPTSSLDEGDLFYNTTSNLMKFYNGSAWVAITSETDVLVKVSSNDTTAGYLNGKLVAGSNITFTEGSDGGNETLTIAGSGASLDDATALAIALG